jgi:tetratricopeptide (TPR) repeat protein
MAKSTFDILLQGLKRIPGIDNDWDRLIYPFGGSLEDDQKRFLGIPDDERVVYVRIIVADVSVPWSLAITDKGIYMRIVDKFFWATTQDEKFNIKFSHVSEVKYSEREDAYIFSDGSRIGRKHLVKKLDSQYLFKFAEILTEASKSVPGVLDYYNRGYSLLDEDKIEEALVEFNIALDIGSNDSDFKKSDERAHVYYSIGYCLRLLERYSEAKTNLIIAKEISSKSSDSDIRNLLPMINAELAFCVDSSIESHKLWVEAYDKVEYSETKKQLIGCLNSLHKSKKFKSDFETQNRLSERKVIIVLRDNTTPIPGKTLLCLERSVVEYLGLCFPMGHPIDGCVYLAHPACSKYYIPAEKYAEAIFYEKARECCYLLKCLGAREITVQTLSGKSVEQMKESTENIGASLGVKSFETNVNYGHRSQNNSTSISNFELRSYMKFNSPINKPYVPKDLNWVAVEPKWKRLIDYRLKGSLEHFYEETSTSENKILTNTEETSVNVEIKALIARFNGSINNTSTVSSSSKQTTTWRIEASFK